MRHLLAAGRTDTKTPWSGSETAGLAPAAPRSATTSLAATAPLALTFTIRHHQPPYPGLQPGILLPPVALEKTLQDRVDLAPHPGYPGDAPVPHITQEPVFDGSAD